MAANKDISAYTSTVAPKASAPNLHYEARIRELEAENCQLRDKLAVDEIKLNLVMSCETQFSSQRVSKTMADMKNQLAEKDAEINRLKKRLRVEEHKSSSHSLKRESSDLIIELLDSNFQCAVCNELLVKATVLGCGHTFCFECIDKWKKKSEGSNSRKAPCPICRCDITTQAFLKNVDSFLDKTVEVFGSEDIKKARKEHLKEASKSQTTSPKKTQDSGQRNSSFVYQRRQSFFLPLFGGFRGSSAAPEPQYIVTIDD